MSAVQPVLIDTTVLVDVSKRREPAASWLNEAIRYRDQICISTVTVAEFFAGIGPAQREDWRFFIERLTHWEVTTEIAIQAGILRYDLARRGRALAISDGLIAATAIVHDAVLVTANIRDFTETGVVGISLSPRA